MGGKRKGAGDASVEAGRKRGSAVEDEDESDGSEAESGELDMTTAAYFEEEEEEDGEEEGDGDGHAEEGLRVDFDFVGASEVYYEAVKVLLGGYLEDVGWDAYGAAEAVVGQTEVGTLVNSGEEEGNAIAMCTVLGLDGALGKGKDGERNWRADVGRYLRQKVGKGALPKVEAALGSRAGLLLLERLINAPVQLAPKLLELTLGEVSGGEYASFLMLSRAVQGAPSGSVGDALLDDSDDDDAGGMVSKKEASKAERQARKKEKKRQRREERQREEELLSYVRPEDVILEANAEWVERWAAHIPEGSGTGGFGQLRPGEKPVRALLCLSRRGLEAACAQLAQAFPEE